ncbi:MAG: histidine phosphatase family protein [Pirellulaceae bacterium]
MQLYLIRHAQSENNSKPEAERIEDPAITELGHRQCDALSKWAASLSIDFLVTSAFLRTLQTTSYISKATQRPINVWRDLHEVGGCYRGHLPGQEQGAPGMSHQAILDAYPQAVVDPSIGPDGWWASRPYETSSQAMQRATLMLNQLMTQFGQTEQTVVAVIHADFKMCLLKLILGDAFVDGVVGPMLNTGVTRFSHTESAWRLEMLNSVTHLPTKWIAG